MSYTYLQEQGAESSAVTFSDIPASVLSSGHPTRGGCCCNGSETACCHGSRCGMMFRRLMVRHGVAGSMSLRAASRVRTYPQRAKVQASTAHVQACGDTWPASLARYDRDSCSWKTRQCSLLGGSVSFSETWPRSGMMRNGVCWERVTPERRTVESASGFLPTPTAHNAKEGAYPAEHIRNTPTLAAQVGGALNPPWVEWLMGWPIGWTDLQPLAMDKYRLWLRSHGER